MKKLEILRLLLVGLAVPFAYTSFARADDSNLTFFPNNMARTVFGSDVEMTLPRYKDTDLDADRSDLKTEDKGTQKQPPTGLASASDKRPVDKASLREDLIKKYGSPNEEPKVRVQDSAPPAFKAMMEALDGGDNELAYDYARQYTKSLQKYQKYYKRVVSMTGEVIKNDARGAEVALENAPLTPEEKNIADQNQNGRVQAILKQAALDESAAVKISAIEDDGIVNSTQDHNRTEIRNALAKEKNLPRSADGKVNLFYFFDSKNTDMMRTSALEVNRLARFRKGDSRLNVIAVSIEKSAPEELAKFQSDTKINLTPQDGSVLAKKLGITNGPVLVLAVPNQKNALFEEGNVTFEYLDELISKVQGAN